MAATLLTSIGFVYFSLLTLASAKTATFPKANFSSLPMPFTYEVWERPLGLSEKAKVYITKYVVALVCMSFGLSWVPLWVLAGGGPIDVLLVANWSMMWLCVGYLAYILAWERFYSFEEPISEWKPIDDYYREKNQREEQLARTQESERLETERRERERRKQWAYAELAKLGLAGVLDEPELPMSEYYVTGDFTEYGDPLAPFREKFLSLTVVNLRDLLEQAGAVQHDPDKVIDIEFLEDTSELEADPLELPPPVTPAQPKPQLEALSGVREQAAAPVENADPAPVPNLPKIEGHIAEHLWDNLRTDWRDVIDSPVAKAEGDVKPYRGRYVPEQLVLSEALLEVVLGGRPAGLKAWRYKGQTVSGMLTMDLETVALYPELRAWLQDPDNRTRLVDLETERDELETLGPFITMDDVEDSRWQLGGWRPPTLALTERAWIIAIGYVPNGETTTSRGIKEPLWKVDLPVEW